MNDCEDAMNKGRVLQGYIDHIKRKWGRDAVELCAKDIKLPQTSFEPERWYPHKYGVDMATWVANNHGLPACRDIGHSIATRRGVVSYVAWIAGMNKVLDRFIIEIRDSANYGKITLEHEDGKATVHFNDVCGSEAGCELWHGVFEGLLDLTKTKGTVQKLKCEHKGEDACVYELSWN